MKRFTRTRWPMSSVGSIEPDGIWYGFTIQAWIASASPRARATMTPSSIKPPALLFGLGIPRFTAAILCEKGEERLKGPDAVGRPVREEGLTDDPGLRNR